MCVLSFSLVALISAKTAFSTFPEEEGSTAGPKPSRKAPASWSIFLFFTSASPLSSLLSI